MLLIAIASKAVFAQVYQVLKFLNHAVTVFGETSSDERRHGDVFSLEYGWNRQAAQKFLHLLETLYLCGFFIVALFYVLHKWGIREESQFGSIDHIGADDVAHTGCLSGMAKSVTMTAEFTHPCFAFPVIINRAGTGICPVEKLCENCTTAADCLPLINDFVNKTRIG